jgi:glycosyltransferase involved in cell wall biosynthesis
MKNILLINRNFGTGGSNTLVISLLNSTILSHKYNLYLALIGKNSNTSYKKTKNKNLFIIKKNINNLSIFWDLIKIIKEKNVKIIHVHSEKLCFYASIIKLFFKIKVVMHFHGPLRESIKKQPFLNQIRILFFDKLVDCKIFVSKDLLEKYKKILKLKTGVFNIATTGSDDLSKKQINKKFIGSINKKCDLKKNDFIILSTGRLNPIKNYEYLVNLAKKILRNEDSFKFLIAGTGEQEQYLNKLIQKYKLQKNVFFLGNIDHYFIPSLISLADLFILTSKYEGVSMSAVEAMSMGLPCLLSNRGANHEIIKKGYNGYLYDIRKVNSAEKIILNLFKNKKLLSNLKINSRKYFQKKFSLRIFHKKIGNIYDSLR